MYMKNAYEKKKKINVFLYFSVITANIAGFGLGATFGWSSPVLPKLNGELNPQHNPLPAPITPNEESWIASLLPLGSAASCFMYGFLADKIGRKKTLLLASIPIILGFMLNAFATHVIYFYAGRLLNGLGCGGIFTLIPLYVGEISETENRGVLGCFFVIFINLGNVFTYSIGPYVSVRVLSLCTALIPVTFLVSFGLLVPESPYYWIAKDNQKEAEKSLMKLRYCNVDIVKRELPEISKNVEESFGKRGSTKDLFCNKAFYITSGLIIFQQISGANFINFYMQSIFQESGNTIPPHIAVIIVSIFRFFAAVGASSLVDRLGRRVLLLTSAAGTALSLVFFATYFLLKENDINVDAVYWLPMFSVVSFVLAFAFGFGSVPYTVLGEVFPPHVKSLASSLTIFICLSFMFCVTNFFPQLINVMGMSYGFFLLSLFCCLGGVFTYFCVPETKGKTLSEIQDLLRK